MRGHLQLVVLDELKSSFNSSFSYFVKQVDSFKAGKVADCGKTFWRHACSNCDSKVLVRIGCNVRRLCPRCSQAMRLSQSEKAVALFGQLDRAFDGLDFINLEGTLSKRLWNFIDDDNINRLGKVFWQCITAYLRKMYGNDLMFGGVYSVHYWHSADVFQGWYPHVHGVVPAVAYDRKKHEYVRFNPHGDVKLFKKMWTEAVLKEFGFAYSREFVVHYEYRSIKSLRHRLSYMFRSPLADVYKHFKDGRSFSDSDIEWSRRMLLARVGVKKYQFCGFLFERVKKKYLDLLNVVDSSMTEFIEEKKDERLRCLTCKKGHYERCRIDAFVRIEDVTDDDVILVYSAKVGRLRSQW